MCVLGLSFSLLQRFYITFILTPPGELQFNCGSDHLESTQTPQVKGTVLHKTAATSDTSQKFMGTQGTHASDYLATNSGVPITPSVLIVC